jgi:signal transduction histidine kinase
METISSAIREGIIVIDLKRVVHYFNPAAAELIGLPENSIGQHIDRFVKTIPWRDIIDSSPENWLNVSRRELEIFYPQHRFLNFYVVPHSVDDELTDGFAIVILNDITEQLKSSEADFETKKSEVISMLAASVAHEIGNPLNSINIHLQLLERLFSRAAEGEFTEDAKEAVSVAKSELARLDTIINNFLKAIRPARLDLQPVNVSELLKESMQFMQMEIENKGILIEADWGEGIPMILADPDQLKQAFYNIMKNAVNAMPEGGVLAVICQSEEGRVKINFQDSGTGISSKDITRILDPYYTTGANGNGLGLMVVERIVRDHGGSLNIVSQLNKGTVFQIVLPSGEKVQKSLPMPEDVEVDLEV